MSATTICGTADIDARWLDQRRDGAALDRGDDEVVAVETLAAQRDEQVAGRERARVGGHAQ